MTHSDQSVTQLTLDGGEVSVTERLDEIADRLERDRREPDKVLCYVLDLRRLASETRAMAHVDMAGLVRSRRS